MEEIKDVIQAALELNDFCVQQNWRFCFIGGIAIQRWGEPRFTKDADISLLTSFENDELYVDALLGRFRPRIPDARDLALQRRVLLLETADSVALDVSLGGLPFEERSVSRAVDYTIMKGKSIRVCCAEDLIVYKAFASRGLDWIDVERIVQRQGRKLNLDLVFEELTPLVELKEEPEILVKLQKMIDQWID